MSNFWYPYTGPGDAAARIGHFADRQIGVGSGITWSDGQRVAILRRPHMSAGHATVLNVLRTHVAAAPPPARPATASSFVDRAKAMFWHIMEIEGQAQIANSQAQIAGAQAMTHWAHDDVWEPAHRWLIGHKKTADGLGVAIDVIGVAAAVVFVISFAPEIGALAIATGAIAATGSTLLFIADGAVFGTEMLGHKETSESIENNRIVQWTRIIATGMTLVDVPIGGSRALVEIGKLGREVEAGASAARAGKEAEAAARARIGKISNPAKHPVPVARRTRQLNRIVDQVAKQHAATHKLSNDLARTRYFDAPAALAATPAGAALITTAPPALALSQRQRGRDENYLKLLEPAGGMPRDVKLEMRASAVGKVAKE